MSLSIPCLKVRVNGTGAWQQGIVVAAPSDTVELAIAAESVQMSGSIEIYGAPVGFVMPTGWTDLGDGIWTHQATAQAVTITLGADWGDFLVRLRTSPTNGPIYPIDPATSVTDESTIIRVPSAGGVVDVWDPSPSDWRADIRKDLRLLLGGGSAVPWNVGGTDMLPSEIIADASVTFTCVGTGSPLTIAASGGGPVGPNSISGLIAAFEPDAAQMIFDNTAMSTDGNCPGTLARALFVPPSWGTAPAMYAMSPSGPRWNTVQWNDRAPAFTFGSDATRLASAPLAALLSGTDLPFTVICGSHRTSAISGGTTQAIWSLGNASSGKGSRYLLTNLPTELYWIIAQESAPTIYKGYVGQTNVLPHIYGARYASNSDADLFVDGAILTPSVVVAGAGLGSPMTFEPFFLGCLMVSTATTAYMEGTDGATWVWDRALSDAEIAAATALMAQRWPV